MENNVNKTQNRDKTKDIKLKDWHMQFIREYVKNGGNAAAAYRFVKPNSTELSARSCSYALMQHNNVKLEIEKLQDELKKDSMCDIKERMKVLTDIIRGGTETGKMKAIEIMNKMEGVGSSTQNININSIESPFSGMSQEDLLRLINGDDDEEDED